MEYFHLLNDDRIGSDSESRVENSNNEQSPNEESVDRTDETRSFKE